MTTPSESDIDLTVGTFEEALDSVLATPVPHLEVQQQIDEIVDQFNKSIAIIVKNIRTLHP